MSDSLNQQFQALFNNAAIGIITANSKGAIILINQFALVQFGYDTKEELLGQKIEILIPSRYKEKHVKLRENYHGSNAHSRPMGSGIDLFAIKKNGTEFPVEVSLSPYETKDGVFVIAFVSDISIRKESENALVRLNAKLEQKVRARTKLLSEALEKEKELNELKSKFVSLASHEFRTPLSTILSSAYLVAKYINGNDQTKRDRHIQRIVSSVNSLNDILNDFLSVGRIEEGKIQVRLSEFNVTELLQTMINEMEPILKKGQKIIYAHDGKPSVLLDPSLLRHISMNLLSNAIKFSPEDSEIKIQTSTNNDEFIIAIKDKGIGIPAEDQQHLFERFFRAGNVTNIQGTGLGLHIVSKYAELMKGTITYHSEAGKGTKFTVKFNLKYK